MKLLNSVLLEGKLVNQIQMDLFENEDWFLLGDDGLKIRLDFYGQLHKVIDKMNEVKRNDVRIVGKIIMKYNTPYIGVEHIEFKKN